MRKIRIDGDLAYVPLTQGYEAIIDAEDARLDDGHTWCASVSRKANGEIRSVYATRSKGPRGGVKAFSIHRELCGSPAGLEVDHIDGNGLNNRRSNLRIATRAQNCRNMRTPCSNTSGHKGVRWKASEKRWQAYIKVDGKVKWLGSHRCKTSAILAYAKASKAFHQEFGRP